MKDVYGYILIDNLVDDVAVQSISLSKSEQVELGKTLKLTPTFYPTTATNKIVTWSSSDETVATVDNAGNIIPKKIGSTVITATSQDGNKKATCTVTVVEAGSGSSSGGQISGGTTSGGSTNGGSNSGVSSGSSTNNGNSASSNKDKTTAVGKLPQTGVGVGIVVAIISIIGIGIFSYSRIRAYRDI